MKKAVTAVAGALALVLGVVAIMSGVVLASLTAAKDRYDAGSFPDSAQAYDVARRVMPDQLGRWEAYFGAGSAELQAGAIESGVQKLSVALLLVPPGIEPTAGEEYSPECRVRINLAIGLIAAGDERDDRGLAAADYGNARRVIAPCDEQELPEKIQEHAEKAQQQADDEPGTAQPDPADGEPRPAEGGADKDRELLERMREAERQRREFAEYDKDFGSKNGENW